MTQVEFDREKDFVVRASGEIDLSNVAQLTEVLKSAAGTTLQGIVLDLSAVQYMDSSAVHTILASYRHLRQQGRKMVLVAGNPSIKSIVSALRLDLLPDLVIANDSASAESAVR